ncbi:MAG: CheR family methyltransferase, partial [Pirellulaceae bacterium]|nr:CheR family methyltransferase [Pirellulaceae bacterium]
MPLTHADIDAVCGLVLDLCGVYLDESKSYLIENRLADLVQRAECSDYVQLARKARLGSIELKTEIVNAITTTETHFFRDATPFDALQHKAVPELVDARAGSLQPRRLRIWSAACSTGQEPYSIAMTLCDLLPDIHDWDISILATDVADDVVQTASRGVYRKLDIERGMNPNLLRKYFIAEGDRWRVSDELRS